MDSTIRVDAIAEIAGCDSFAAILKYCSENEVQTIVPTYVYTGTEYGDFHQIEKNLETLRDHLEKELDILLLDLVELKDQRLWWALNGRFMSTLFNKYGFFTPCIGCHLYVHLARIQLAKRLNCGIIISGERECHDRGIKINQTPDVIDTFVNVMSSVNIELVLPVWNIRTNKELRQYADWLWPEGDQQLSCILRGNYTSAENNSSCIDISLCAKYIDEFLLPVGKKLAAELLEGRDDYLSTIESVFKRDS